MKTQKVAIVGYLDGSVEHLHLALSMLYRCDVDRVVFTGGYYSPGETFKEQLALLSEIVGSLDETVTFLITPVESKFIMNKLLAMLPKVRYIESQSLLMLMIKFIGSRSAQYSMAFKNPVTVEVGASELISSITYVRYAVGSSVNIPAKCYAKLSTYSLPLESNDDARIRSLDTVGTRRIKN